MSTESDLPPSQPSEGDISGAPDGDGSAPVAARLVATPIEEELKDSYLTYAMSVIISRALPDVRDGLKPSQRRILVAMNDLGLTPGAATSKCAGIVGETMKRYHPHGDQAIYPTLVRLAQEWNTRYPLIDKQGNFGSIAGLPAAAMRYTEARMSPLGALMLEDYKMETVEFVPTYDEKGKEPTVLPSAFPNLLVNGSQGIAVGMATSIPPHNLAEICDALIRVIDDLEVSIDELLETCPGPDFPTGGIICGRESIRQGYQSGRGKITVRARTRIEEVKGRQRIIVQEIPYQQARDAVEEAINKAIEEGHVEGVAEVRNESDLKEPVRLVIELKRDAEPQVVLNQLYRHTPLQDTFSLNFLALVDGKPRVLSFKELLEEYLRHRATVIRRRTEYQLGRARERKHTVEGLLLALADIEAVIRVIRSSASQAEAKERLMQIACPAAMLQRALGEEGFAAFAAERGAAQTYTLTPVQADAILRMTLGQLVNLEQEKLANEHRKLLADIAEYRRILADRAQIDQIIRNDLVELKRKFGDARRTEIQDEDLGQFDLEDLIAEETVVVSITSNGYIKRTPIRVYRQQRRGGKGVTGAKVDEEDPVQDVFVASTHDAMLFFTNKGRVYWKKVYAIPELPRDRRGRAIVNLLSLGQGELVTDCRAVRDFQEADCFLMMATRRGVVKKTALAAFARPAKNGILAIHLREGDELVDVVVTRPGDEVVLATARGMAIRFPERQVRPMGRTAAGVKGISLLDDDHVVGMVVADPAACLLTACANGFGKRTPMGGGCPPGDAVVPQPPAEEGDEQADAISLPSSATEDSAQPAVAEGLPAPEPEAPDSGDSEDTAARSAFYYRTQSRGGKGVRDIKTNDRNGPVIGIARVYDDDEVMMVTARGKLQRVAVKDIRMCGRNTQGVRLITLEEGDTLVAVKRVPHEESEDR